jgi:hypothetical protein
MPFAPVPYYDGSRWAECVDFLDVDALVKLTHRGHVVAEPDVLAAGPGPCRQGFGQLAVLVFEVAEGVVAAVPRVDVEDDHTFWRLAARVVAGVRGQPLGDLPDVGGGVVDAMAESAALAPAETARGVVASVSVTHVHLADARGVGRRGVPDPDHRSMLPPPVSASRAPGRGG